MANRRGFRTSRRMRYIPLTPPRGGWWDLILDGGENRAPGETGARVVEFLEAGYRSAASGRP